MNSLMMWGTVAGASLLAVAMVVAWWEHVGRVDPTAVAAGPNAVPSGSPQRAVTVDVSLDELEAESIAAPTSSDSAARKEALDGALVRMVRTGSVSDSLRHWPDTTPMVSLGTFVDINRQAAGDAAAR